MKLVFGIGLTVIGTAIVYLGLVALCMLGVRSDRDTEDPDGEEARNG